MNLVVMWSLGSETQDSFSPASAVSERSSPTRAATMADASGGNEMPVNRRKFQCKARR